MQQQIMVEYHGSMMNMMQSMHKNMEEMPMHLQIKMPEQHIENMLNKINQKLDKKEHI
ncbi:hypothetical protein [Pseudoalteromonas sp. S1691]|uniref:hypothetical protein n=1 Tax=Pseudoalteromonas sp. S1691 TaxID=579513 RepID=UPI002016EAF0|nr:hypothetical protein [Pseudoalteromonas sp. S1691]